MAPSEAKSRFAGKSLVAFPEVREKSVQWFDSLRTSWLDRTSIDLQAQPGEYFTYQVAVWAIDDLKGVQVEFSDLVSPGASISADVMTCFNTGGVNSHGKPFTKDVDVSTGRVQSMWIGVDLEKAANGTYAGEVRITSDKGEQTIPLKLTVSGEKVANHGYGQGKRMSRMNWLNNTIALDDELTAPFTPVKRNGQQLEILGRSFDVGADGLPASITTYFTPSVQSVSSEGEPILEAPFRFVIEKEGGEIIRLIPGRLQFSGENGQAAAWSVTSTSPEVDVECSGSLEYEGYAGYEIKVKAHKDIAVKDIRLEVPVEKEKARYMMGLHHEGGFRPEGAYLWKWDTISNQDMVWLGDIHGGMRIKFFDENYRRPLINIYYEFGRIKLPTSWGNGGKGGINISERNDCVLLTAYSGRREMKKGEVLHYDFDMLVTPFRTISKEVMFGDRYFHGGGTDESAKVGMAGKAGANIINIHHAGDLYPFINYPYLDENVEALKGIIKDAHDHGMKMKLYYTTRELTKNLPEFWAFNSLNGEILYPGPGNASRTNALHPNGPHQWLIDNVREKYIPAWHNYIDRGLFKGEIDLSVVTTPDSRLNNFYIGGLDWMVRNMNLDGVYIDDSALDRTTLRRARKVIDRVRPGGRMDLHSCNHSYPDFGNVSCLNMYMELLPYFDLCWIGEGRDYNRMPDHWLIEAAGIPYGLPSQMLGEGNPWRGMVFGMTDRAGWGGNPGVIWKFWDEYSIRDKDMVGYWDRNNPVATGNDLVKATLYKGNDCSIISIAGWGNADHVVSLDIDWEKLGYSQAGCTFMMPGISDFQQECTLSSLENITIPKGKGYLIVLRPKR